MSNPYVGEIRLFGGNFAPQGWMFCDGSLLSIAENTVLFDLIGTTYGGNGVNNFALPDLRGRVPVHQGTSQTGSTFVMGQNGGSETVTLTSQQMPQHTHLLVGSGSTANVGTPGGSALAATAVNSYGPPPAVTPMATQAIDTQGGSQPHTNLAPYLAISYIISLYGIFPSQN